MENIFQKNQKDIIIPIFKSEINEKSFINFFDALKQLKKEELKEFLEKLKTLIEKSPVIGQIILDINDLFKLDENGLIEILIDKYLYEDSLLNEKIEEFIEFISKFQIGKNIYDYIYKKIGNILRPQLIIKENPKIIFKKCIDLLYLLYQQREIVYEVYKDNFFYLYNNEMNTNITKENVFKIGDSININLFIFINEFYNNENSIITKISFTRTDELIIKLSNKIDLNISYNYNIIHSTILLYNKWNLIKIKIKPDYKIKKCDISIYINEENYNYTINKEMNEIIDLSFFSKFCGIVSPIIISEDELKDHNYFSKNYIKQLLIREKIDDNIKINQINLESNDDNINSENYNEIPFIICIRKEDSIYNNQKVPILLNNYRTKFPYFYSFNNLTLKENIFLIGGIKNTIPLFEIMFNLYKDCPNNNNNDDDIIKVFSKINQIIASILSFNNNIVDAVNCNFFKIFAIIIEKLNKYNKKLLIETQIIFEKLIYIKNKNDSIYNEIKGLLFNQDIVQILSNKDNELLEFLLNLTKNKTDVFYYLINIILENHNKEMFNKDFYDKIFTFFYQYLENENENDRQDKIQEIFVFLYTQNMNVKIMERTLNLLLKLLSINISSNQISMKLNNQKKEIINSLSLGEKERYSEIIQHKNEEENIIKNKIEKKKQLFRYIIKSHLLHILENISQIEKPNIKLLILNIFQNIILFYVSLFKDIDIEHLKEYTLNIDKFKGKQYIYEYDNKKTQNIYEQISNLFPENKNNKNDEIDLNNNDITYKLYLDLIEIVQTTNKINFISNYNYNINCYQNDILLFFENFLSLVRTNHFSQYYDKEKLIHFYDLYHNFQFNVSLIPLLYHIYLLNDQKVKNIKKLIENIITEIYLDGIDKGSFSFLYIIDKFECYIYENYENENIKNFHLYFFSMINDKISFINSTEEDSDIIDNFGNEFYNDILMNYKEIYSSFTSIFKNNKICHKMIFKSKSILLDYLILKKFFTFYEIISVQTDLFQGNLRNFIVLIIFCILLSDKTFQKYTKGYKEGFFLKISLFAIKAMLFKVFLNKDNHNVLTKLITLFMSILFFALKNYQIEFQNKNYEKSLKNYSYEFYIVFIKSKDDFSYIEKAKTLINNNKTNYIEFFKINNENEIPFQVDAFPYILTEIFLEYQQQKFRINQISENNMIKKLKVIKSYKTIKKQLFSFNGSYSDLNLFYSDEGKSHLKYKILNHYTEEMSLPFLIPILNFNSYIPEDLNINFFNENFEAIDFIGKSFIDDDFEQIKIETLNNKKKILEKENETISDKDILIYYFKIHENNVYSCCLIKQGLHIQGYIIPKKDEFDFIGFPRNLKDPNYLYYDEGKNLCFGSFYKKNNIYYLNIKISNILFVYKRFYIFKDNALEFFTKENKSYFFEFNNLDFNSQKTMTKIRDLFFNYITKTSNSNKYERYFYSGKSKGLYNNIDSLLESVKRKNISRFEFLMRINLLSNRSYKDINQYPIFPWIISNYSLMKEDNEIKNLKDLLKKNNLRPLSQTISSLDENRLNKSIMMFDSLKSAFINTYNDLIPFDYSKYDKLKSIKNYKIIPSFFIQHYLDSNIVFYFMNKIFPYSTLFFLRNKEKIEDKLLIDLNNHYINITKKGKNHFNELIPELYYNSEILRNINNFNYGNMNLEKEGDSTYDKIIKKYNIKEKEIKINNVYLPYWSNNNPEKFICIMREILERPEIKIFDWVDLIFGFAQRGPEALKKYNIYSHWTYEDFINLEDVNLNDRQLYINLSPFGVNPSQILTKKISENQNYYYEKKEKTEKKDFIESKMVINDLLNKIKEYVLRLSAENYDMNEMNEKKNKKNKKKQEIKVNYKELIKQNEIKIEKSKRIVNKIINNNCEIKTYKQIAIIYNLYEGDILMYNTKMTGKEFKLPINIRANLTKNNIIPNNLDNSEITSSSIDKFFIFGTRLGSILICKSGRDKIDKIIHNNNKKITCIQQNSILNIFISSSEDGYLNIYTLPDSILINSIFLPNFYVNYILISYTPIPAFLIYNNYKKVFKSFSINGRNLLNYDKYLTNVKDPKIEENDNFIEYITINENDSKKYKMPYLEIMDNYDDFNGINNKIIFNSIKKIGNKRKNRNCKSNKR